MPLYMHNSRLLKIDGALAVGEGCCCNPPPDPPDGGGGGWNRCTNYFIEAKWQGLTMIHNPLAAWPEMPSKCSTNPCGKFLGGTVDAYMLGIFREVWLGHVLGCFYGGAWAYYCQPIPPPPGFQAPEECSFGCSCMDLALDPPEPCGSNPADAEYTFTGYVVTLYDPVDAQCFAPDNVAMICGFRGGVRVFKYTCVLLASETNPPPVGGPKSFKDATVEEVLYPQPPAYDPNGTLGPVLACNGHPAAAPTVRLYFPVP